MGDVLDWLLTALAYAAGLWLWALLLLTVASVVAMPFIVAHDAWRDR